MSFDICMEIYALYVISFDHKYNLIYFKQNPYELSIKFGNYRWFRLNRRNSSFSRGKFRVISNKSFRNREKATSIGIPFLRAFHSKRKKKQNLPWKPIQAIEHNRCKNYTLAYGK